mgnify:FL=1
MTLTQEDIDFIKAKWNGASTGRTSVSGPLTPASTR